MRDRRGQVLFIDARKMGVLVDRTRRELTDEQVQQIADTYHAWRGEDLPRHSRSTSRHSRSSSRHSRSSSRHSRSSSRHSRSSSRHSRESGNPETRYQDIPGFCKSASLDDIRKHGHVLTPGRYVGAAAQEEDSEPFEEKMLRLTAQWREQRAEAARLDAVIAKNLEHLGFGG